MSVSQVISYVLNINEKYYKAIENKIEDEGYFEVLHASLTVLKSSLDKKSLEEMPLATKLALEKLEKKILEKTSSQYKEAYEHDLKEQSKKEAERSVKQVRHIGFI